MIEQKLIPIGFVAVALVAVVAVTQSAYCQAEGYYSLMIQQSPVDAGFISPGVGIHHMAVGEHVTLTAIPKPGYRFVYWMGNVSDASASEAIVVMAAPKIVVAIFERAEHELLLGAGDFADGQGGGSALVGIGVGISGGGPVSTNGSPKPPKNPPFVVPDDDDDDDFPVPVPEPATVVLLGTGGLMLLRRKKR